MAAISLLSSLVVFSVVFQLFSFTLAVDSAREPDIMNETLTFHRTRNNQAGVGYHLDENLQTVYWNHTATVIGNCTTPSNFLLPWQPTRFQDCKKKSEIDIEGQLSITIEIHGEVNTFDAPCNWFICTSENQFIQMTLDLSWIEAYERSTLARHIAVCAGYTILANQTLSCRKIEDINQLYQTFITTDSVAVLSLLSVPQNFYAYIQILNYDPTCGGIYIGKMKGTIESPGYPTYGFPQRFYCRYKFVVAPGERINFTVTSFAIPSNHMSCQYAKMIIRDGLDLAFPYVSIYCDQNPPPSTFLSHSNAVEISFHLDDYFWNQKREYQISWRAVPSLKPYNSNMSNLNTSTSAMKHTQYDVVESESSYAEDFENGQSCGGLLIDGEGFIKLDFPYNYQDDVSCTWLLHVDFRNAVDGNTTYARLSLFQMRVYGTPDCSLQFLEIVEGCMTTDLKTDCIGGRITKYCSNVYLDKSPSTTAFAGKYIKIRFFKKGYVSYYSLRAYFQYLDYNPDAPCPISYAPESGSLMTLGYPNNFPNFFECNWEIIVLPGYRLHFKFAHFLFEDEYGDDGDLYSVFSFRDGLDAPVPALARDVLQIRRKSRNFSSTYNHVGFHLKSGYTPPGKNKSIKIGWTTKQLGCNETLDSYSGTIASPGYPDRIKPGTFCVWNITVTRGYAVKITFVDIDVITPDDVACKHTYIEIIDGSIEDDMKFDNFCSIQAVGSLTTKTNFVHIALKVSDVHVNRKDIKFRYEAVCNRQLQGFKGVVESINYPEVYPYSIDCLWELQGTPGNTIVLNFYRLKHKDNVFLKKSLKIYECDSKCTLLHEDIMERSILRVQDKSVKIVFNTITDVKNVVFQLHWWIEGCAFAKTEFNGTIQSPNYPKRYAQKLHCMWKIMTAPGTRVQLTLHHWKLEQSKHCQFDALKIYGGSNEDSQQLTRLCGGKGKLNFAKTMTSHYNTMFITLTTDDTIEESGFTASFQQIDKTDNTLCNGNVDGIYGYIYSPDYPDPYQNLEDCTTTVRVHPNFRAAIRFLHFDVEGGYYFDVVWVLQSDMTPIAILRKEPEHFPGDTAFVSRDNTIIVNFESNWYEVGVGFKAIYYQTCGATLRSEFGTIATPDYMTIMIMPSNSGCNWTIEAPSRNHRVALLFFELAWNTTDESCSEHLIQVFSDDKNASTTDKEIDETFNSILHYSDCCDPPLSPIISKGNSLTLEMRGVGDIWFSAFYLIISPECLQQLDNKWWVTEDNRTHDVCVKRVTMDVDNSFSFYITFRNFSSVNKNGTSGTTPCSTNFLEIYEDGFAGAPLRTVCRQNIPTGIFKAPEEKYIIVYLVDEPREQQKENKSTFPWDINEKRNDCPQQHCQPGWNVVIISAAVLIMLTVVAAGVLRMGLQIRQQRRES